MTARMTLILTKTWLMLVASRSLKMAALIVVEESTDILRLRLQLELARAEERKVQAEQIVCVKKRNRKIRLTCEYRSINLMTVDNAYGMADRTELIERAAKAKYVSTIDLASAYSQVAMSPESKLLTSFRPGGSFSIECYASGFKKQF